MAETKKSILEYLDIVSEWDSIKPILPFIAKAMRDCSAELAPLLLDFQEFLRETRGVGFKKYLSLGFTREEALLLLLDEQTAIKKLLETHKK